MPDLTPEERQRIYLEEKARLEIRRELEGKKTSVGKIIGSIMLCGFGFLALMWIIGSFSQQSETDAFQKLTPQQRHQKTLENCADLLKSMQFKTYSELTILERQTKAACEEQLKYPEREIFKPSQ
jgi:hypothetical protein